MRFPAALLCLCLCGCGRYADFTLPSPSGEPAIEAAYDFSAEPAPVLAPGAPGEWDSVDVLNPSVVRYRDRYFNFYSGFDGRTWRTGMAVSKDGLRWEKSGMVLAPDPASWEGGYIAANGSAAFVQDRFLYWYQAGPRERPRIGLARSGDGRRWRKLPEPVLETGPRGSWDERGLGDPYVIRAGGSFYLFYLGQDRARRQRLGLARSEDGIDWEKLRSNPILEPGEAGSFDENGLGEPAVWSRQGYYWMVYTGRDREENRSLGMARSRDGARWEKLPFVFRGPQAWNRRVLCDPEVEARDGSIRLWFGGGDRPSPDENLNGQIGVGLLSVRED
ncbi:MAG: hypothetical protein IT158_27600 [Bryobacterales bacterium]|nr:hypothetical protein [Bryobacterales bacterium]